MPIYIFAYLQSECIRLLERSHSRVKSDLVIVQKVAGRSWVQGWASTSDEWKTLSTQ